MPQTMKVEIQKVDYEDPEIRRMFGKSDFRIVLHVPGHHFAGEISRTQLVVLKDEISKLLRTTKKPQYTIDNKSSQTAAIEADCER